MPTMGLRLNSTWKSPNRMFWPSPSPVPPWFGEFHGFQSSAVEVDVALTVPGSVPPPSLELLYQPLSAASAIWTARSIVPRPAVPNGIWMP